MSKQEKIKKVENAKSAMHGGKKNTMKYVLAGAICIVVVASGAWYVISSNKTKAEIETVYKETSATKGTLTAGITESGTTVLGTETIMYDIEGTTSSSTTSQTTSQSSQAGTQGNSSSSSSTTSMPSLVVKEVMVAESDSVKKGDSILTVTNKSYNAVKTYLEDAVTSAKLALKEAQIKRTLTQTSADNTYKANSSAADLAKETYNNTITKLANQVTNTSKELTEAKSQISELKTAINNNTYYSDYEIVALNKAITTKQTKVAAIEEKLKSAKPEKEQELKTQLEDAIKEVEAAQNAYDQGYEKYENALSQAKDSLDKLENSLSSLQLSYDEAVTNQKKGKLEAEATYKEALITTENASTLYEINTHGIDDEVTAAQDKVDVVTEQLESFHALVDEGKIVSTYEGLVTSLGYSAGDMISTGTAIATIADASKVTITVSVDQEDIASIAVNNEVDVAFSAYNQVTYKAIVSSISTTPSTDNSSTVTYPVVVTLTGDVSAIYSGMSADVTFITKQIEDVLYVSNKAIMNEGTKSYIKVKNNDGTITQVEVETGFSDGNNVEVISGISEGDIVLVESQVKKN